MAGFDVSINGRFCPVHRGRVVKSLTGGTVTTGEREIEPVEAAIVERIFGNALPESHRKRLPGG
jgi:hypothetical protein